MFKDIEGYESYYQVNELGEVKSTPHDGKKERILKQEVIKKKNLNYRRVTLSKNGVTKQFQVHRLVAKVFVPNPKDKPFVNHIDNDGENNHVTNLEWCTHEENMLHSEIQGRQTKSHYLGGKAAGKLKADKAKLLWDSRVGKTFGVLTLLHITKYTGKPEGDVRCTLCGTVTNRILQGMINRPPKQCRKCFENKRK
jgi:hypothetical protein